VERGHVDEAAGEAVRLPIRSFAISRRVSMGDPLISFDGECILRLLQLQRLSRSDLTKEGCTSSKDTVEVP